MVSQLLMLSLLLLVSLLFLVSMFCSCAYCCWRCFLLPKKPASNYPTSTNDKLFCCQTIRSTKIIGCTDQWAKYKTVKV
jgi:hypothetical protein